MFAISEASVEGLTRNAVIDTPSPFFSWKMISDKRNIIQKNYRISAGTSYGSADMWDSGEIISYRSCNIV